MRGLDAHTIDKTRFGLCWIGVAAQTMKKDDINSSVVPNATNKVN